jgi:hypothetical protein
MHLEVNPEHPAENAILASFYIINYDNWYFILAADVLFLLQISRQSKKLVEISLLYLIS